MLFFFRMLNVVLLIGLAGCIAGAMSGLIIFAPFFAGAWWLTTIAIVGLDPAAEAECQPGPLAATVPPRRLRADSTPHEARVRAIT